KRTVCPQCNMSYIQHLKQDKQLHDKFHKRVFEGLEISLSNESDPTLLNQNEFFIKSFKLSKLQNKLGFIIQVDYKNSKLIALTKDFLNLINLQLNAPDDNSNYLNGSQFGKVFLFIIDSKAVGLISIDILNSLPSSSNQGHWMVYETGNLVPNVKVPLIAGISRIYISEKYRRCGIASLLLDTILNHSIYGMKLKKYQIGWSQPSEFGGKLAVNFNAVKHEKSGKLLIPVYKE
ncbi:hypothetical protein CANARDRAFT_185327, partial [[Candida] arabinofermentans NRRL YB-2248]